MDMDAIEILGLIYGLVFGVIVTMIQTGATNMFTASLMFLPIFAGIGYFAGFGFNRIEMPLPIKVVGVLLIVPISMVIITIILD